MVLRALYQFICLRLEYFVIGAELGACECWSGVISAGNGG